MSNTPSNPYWPRNQAEARQRAAERAENACAKWNQLYPVGTKVRVYRQRDDESTAIDTTTTSQAWVIAGHSTLVSVLGLSGGQPLTHVKPRIGSATHPEGERVAVAFLGHDLGATIATQLESGVAV